MESTSEARNWLDLPTEVMFMILLKLGAIEVLITAQNVCSSWRNISKDPLLWRVIDVYHLRNLLEMRPEFESVCKQAVDRSGGHLVDIGLVYFVTDHLLQYITQSSNKLRTLRISSCYGLSDEALTEAFLKLPMLEYLEIFTLEVETLKTAGRCCPLLKSLKLNNHFDRRPAMERDQEALAIAETMPNLQHLQILGNSLTNTGLQAILDGCPDLESLDLRDCFNLKLAVGMLGKECAERIKDLHLPDDAPFIVYEAHTHCACEAQDFYGFMAVDEDDYCGFFDYEE